MNSSDPYDVVAIGETMLRLTSGVETRLEQALSLQVHVGGSESNTAVGLARLGKRVAWLSRLPANPLGRMVVQTIAAHGVDTQHVVWAPNERLGIYFFEEGSPPRPSQVTYDRADSAFAHFGPEQLPEALFRHGAGRWLHFTGISLALGPRSRDLIERAVSLARGNGWKISFDVNYRALLWSAADARKACEPYLADADLVFSPARDARLLWQLGHDRTSQQVLDHFLELRHGKPTVLTLGSEGAIAGASRDSTFVPCQPVPPLGRLGGGDAFTAGFLSAWLDDADLPTALRWAVATARLKYSIAGDLPLISRAEVEQALAADGGQIRR
jgi:2-dehydro-3-deoxygluconokinase